MPVPETSPLPRGQELVQATYDLLPFIREARAQERAILDEIGFTFSTLVEPKSLDQIIAQNPDYFGNVNPSQKLRSYKPPKAFEIFVNPNQWRLRLSNNCSQERQIQKSNEYTEYNLLQLLGAKAIMLPTTAYAQLEISYMRRRGGKKIFSGFLVRTLDSTEDRNGAIIGRRYREEAGPLVIDYWDRESVKDDIYAILAVVFVASNR